LPATSRATISAACPRRMIQIGSRSSRGTCIGGRTRERPPLPVDTTLQTRAKGQSRTNWNHTQSPPPLQRRISGNDRRWDHGHPLRQLSGQERRGGHSRLLLPPPPPGLFWTNLSTIPSPITRCGRRIALDLQDHSVDSITIHCCEPDLEFMLARLQG